MISKEDILKIKEALPHNYIAIIKEKLNNEYSDSYISQVLRSANGKYNDVIIEAALLLAEETICKKIALKERIETLQS